MERLYATAHDFGKAGYLANVRDVYVRATKRPRRAGGGDELHAQLRERVREPQQIFLVMHGNQRPSYGHNAWSRSHLLSFLTCATAGRIAHLYIKCKALLSEHFALSEYAPTPRGQHPPVDNIKERSKSPWGRETTQEPARASYPQPFLQWSE